MVDAETPDACCVADACGGVFDVSNGTITSPSFPELYPVNKNCVWEIIAPPQYRITLNFTHFELEGNNVSKFMDGLKYNENMWSLCCKHWEMLQLV
jgi:hypothetical protein